VSGWQTALDNKLDVVEWSRERQALRFLEGYAKDVRAKRGEAPAMAFEYATDKLATKLIRSTPMYVHPDIVDIAEEAVKSFRPEPLIESDVIAPWCFISLPRPVLVPDRHGLNTAFSRVSWAPAVMQMEGDDQTVGGLSVILWSTGNDAELDDHSGTFRDMLSDARAKGHEAQLRREMRLSILHGTVWAYGKDAPPEGEVGTGWYSWVQVLMRLSMQQISTQTHVIAPRASRRRAKRLGIDEPTVLVVKLRRSREGGKHSEGRHIEYSHRFIVSGHWRQQPYPREGITRQIWISDFIKGDPDKPLRIHAGRAFELVR
jgi:hypothetical protein